MIATVLVIGISLKLIVLTIVCLSWLTGASYKSAFQRLRQKLVPQKKVYLTSSTIYHYQHREEHSKTQKQPSIGQEWPDYSHQTKGSLQVLKNLFDGLKSNFNSKQSNYRKPTLYWSTSDLLLPGRATCSQTELNMGAELACSAIGTSSQGLEELSAVPSSKRLEQNRLNIKLFLRMTEVAEGKRKTVTSSKPAKCTKVSAPTQQRSRLAVSLERKLLSLADDIQLAAGFPKASVLQSKLSSIETKVSRRLVSKGRALLPIITEEAPNQN